MYIYIYAVINIYIAAVRYVCSRCHKPYIVYNDGGYQTVEECVYHYGRLYKSRGKERGRERERERERERGRERERQRETEREGEREGERERDRERERE